MACLAYLLHAPPEAMFERQLQVCVYVPLGAVIVIRLLARFRPGSLASFIVGGGAAIAVLRVAGDLLHDSYSYVPSLGYYAAIWIAALTPFVVSTLSHPWPER